MSRDHVYLLDMLMAARRAVQHLRGISRDALDGDSLVQDAVFRALEVVGEAARLVSEETRKEHGSIPWFEVIGMRNRLLHEYFRVDLDIVWRTIQEDLPPLIRQLEGIVPPEEGQ